MNRLIEASSEKSRLGTSRGSDVLSGNESTIDRRSHLIDEVNTSHSGMLMTF